MREREGGGGGSRGNSTSTSSTNRKRTHKTVHHSKVLFPPNENSSGKTTSHLALPRPRPGTRTPNASSIHSQAHGRRPSDTRLDGRTARPDGRTVITRTCGSKNLLLTPQLCVRRLDMLRPSRPILPIPPGRHSSITRPRQFFYRATVMAEHEYG